MNEIIIPTPMMIFDRQELHPGRASDKLAFFTEGLSAIHTPADTSMLARGEIAGYLDFRVEGIILHAPRVELWHEAWFDLESGRGIVLSFGCLAGRISGMALTPRGCAPVFNRGDPNYSASLRWSKPEHGPRHGEKILAVIVGTAISPYAQPQQPPRPVESPGVFAWILAGDEKPDWFKEEAFEIVRPQAAEKPRPSSTVVRGAVTPPKNEGLIKRVLRKLMTPKSGKGKPIGGARR